MNKLIEYHISLGSVTTNFGCIKTPVGYEIMRDFDDFYYWIRSDGVESVKFWDRWAARRAAVADSKGEDDAKQ